MTKNTPPHGVVTLALFWLLLAWNIFSYLFTLNLFVPLKSSRSLVSNMKSDHVFLVHSANLCFLTREVKPLYLM